MSELGLDPGELTKLAGLAAKLGLSENLNEAEWLDVQLVLTTGRKRTTEYAAWLAEESSLGTFLQYWRARRAALPRWRAPVEDRLAWEAELARRSRAPAVDPDRHLTAALRTRKSNDRVRALRRAAGLARREGRGAARGATASRKRPRPVRRRAAGRVLPGWRRGPPRPRSLPQAPGEGRRRSARKRVRRSDTGHDGAAHRTRRHAGRRSAGSPPRGRAVLARRGVVQAARCDRSQARGERDGRRMEDLRADSCPGRTGRPNRGRPGRGEAPRRPRPNSPRPARDATGGPCAAHADAHAGGLGAAGAGRRVGDGRVDHAPRHERAPLRRLAARGARDGPRRPCARLTRLVRGERRIRGGHGARSLARDDRRAAPLQQHRAVPRRTGGDHSGGDPRCRVESRGGHAAATSRRAADGRGTRDRRRRDVGRRPLPARRQGRGLPPDDPRRERH